MSRYQYQYVAFRAIDGPLSASRTTLRLKFTDGLGRNKARLRLPGKADASTSPAEPHDAHQAGDARIWLSYRR